KRLGDVVVGAQLEAEHLVALVHAAGHHDDGDAPGVRILLEPAADLPAVEPGHHDVEEDDGGLAVPGVANGISAAGQDGDLVPFLVEVEPDQLGDVRLGLDDDNPARPITSGGAGGLPGGAAAVGGGRHLSGGSHAPQRDRAGLRLDDGGVNPGGTRGAPTPRPAGATQ